MEGLSLGFGADVLTVIGFLVTLRVWQVTGTLSKKFLRRARLPQIKKDLEGMSSELLIAMTKDDSMATGGVLARLDASLESIGGKLPYRKTKVIRSLRKRIKIVRQKPMLDIHLTKGVYNELLGVIQYLSELESDNVIGAD